MRFGMFYLNEYAGLTIMSMVAVTLFFGGWQGPFGDRHPLLGRRRGSPHPLVPRQDLRPGLRADLDPPSLPRLQVDQLMAFAWKILIPLGPGQHPGHRAPSSSGCRSWKFGLAVFGWVAFFAFVGLFDPILKWRLRKQRERQPVVSA